MLEKGVCSSGSVRLYQIGRAYRTRMAKQIKRQLSGFTRELILELKIPMILIYEYMYSNIYYFCILGCYETVMGLCINHSIAL